MEILNRYRTVAGLAVLSNDLPCAHPNSRMPVKTKLGPCVRRGIAETGCAPTKPMDNKLAANEQLHEELAAILRLARNGHAKKSLDERMCRVFRHEMITRQARLNMLLRAVVRMNVYCSRSGPGVRSK